MKILLIEDDQTLAKNLKQVLIKAGFAVDSASSKEEAGVAVEVNEYDCLVLDLNLPDGNGFDFLKSIRSEDNETPVIIVTARGQVEDRVRGLNLGADDYVPKPVDSEELIARIRALIRRNSRMALPVITIGELTVKPAEHTASVAGQQLELTAKEFSVLEYLAQYSGQVITRAMMMEHIWGSDFDTFSNVIDVYVRNIRRKIEAHTKTNLIRTIRGKGYILGSDEN